MRANLMFQVSEMSIKCYQKMIAVITNLERLGSQYDP